MNALDFKANVRVRLIMGSPEMTVVGPATTEGYVWCHWYVGDVRHGGAFSTKWLEIVDADVEPINPPESQSVVETPSFGKFAA